MTSFAVVARAVNAAASLATVVCIGHMAEKVAGRRARLWTMAFAGFEAASTYYAHTSNLDTPALFWACLALAALSRTVRTDCPSDLRRVSLFAACAVATKDQMYGAFVLTLPMVTAAWAADRRRQGKPLAELMRETLRFAVVTPALVLLLDGAFMNPTGFVSRVRFLVGPASQDFAEYTRDTAGRLAALRDALTFLPKHYPVAAGLVFVAGIALALARNSGLARIAACVPLAAMASFTLTFNCVARRVEERFMLPQMQLIAIYGGCAVAWALHEAPWSRAPIDAVRHLPDRIRSSLQRTLRLFFRFGAALVVLACVRMSLIVVAEMLRDARYDAEAFLNEHVAPGETIETYGTNVYLPRFPQKAHITRIDITSPTSRNPLPDTTEVQDKLGNIASRRPAWVVVSTGYAWRFLRDRVTIETGRNFAESQRRALDSDDTTTHIRNLVSGASAYPLVHRSHYEGVGPWLPPRPLHASLACDVLIFKRQ